MRLSAMVPTLLRLISLLVTAGRLRSDLALENLALRQELAVLRRQQRSPKLRNRDRFFRLLLSRSWADRKETLLIVKPETVLRWHRKRFASHWTRLSRQHRSRQPGLKAVRSSGAYRAYAIAPRTPGGRGNGE